MPDDRDMTAPGPLGRVNTTHDWTAGVDHAHLATIRQAADVYAPGGQLHLILEVVAYADEEAQALGRRGHCVVTLHSDGSVAVADDGRGTETRRAPDGQAVRKPIMATKDLRLFDGPQHATLPDGRRRRGMSVVAALSDWLVHTNHRPDGSWTQRYERGVPATDLVALEPTAKTGTTVRFHPDPTVIRETQLSPEAVRRATTFPHLAVAVLVQ